MPSKDSWPELVGAEGKVAKATIERENPLVTALILHIGAPITQDLRFDRVRVWLIQMASLLGSQ
ncbi:Serine protease inhibitor, potato inhibitor I-type family protein [Prunus dulcis]|uniref:Serine protease inhibitor, potato inhibitor I-type family protein n=1 Tax=Prunus dulcis TaxID=3755 RepID=A0A4Y1QKM3_PRUDU|nr:Serine protease inhibitor, potato inhibitor I-type family protein [Prunus dulcis]